MEKSQLLPFAVEIRGLSALLLKFFNQDLELRLKEYGVRVSGLQYGILQMLQAEPLTISELSQRFGMDPSTLVRTVDNLEKKKLVKRGSDPADRRRNPITLTGEGRKLLEEVPVVKEEDKIFSALQSLETEEIKRLSLLLEKVLRAIPEGNLILDSHSENREV